MKAGRYLLLLACVVISAPAQEPREISIQQSPATFSSDVNLISVPVVVRDSKGRAVGNLRQEDFRLFDKGKPQVITKFSVNHGGGLGTAQAGGPQAQHTNTKLSELPAVPPQAALPDRYVAYVFDDIHLKFEDLARVRTATEQHFASLAPNSRAAIYTTSGRVTLDFTADREKLHEALLRLGPVPNAGPSPDGVCPDVISAYEADLILDKQDQLANQAAFQELAQCLPPAAITKGTIEIFSERALTANNINTQSVMSMLASVVQRISVMPGSRSIVLASPGFLLLGQLRAAKETELMDRAIRSNVTISSLDARGLLDPWLGEAGSTKERMDSLRMRYRREEADADKDVMAELADGTGGRFFKNDNGLKEGLDLLAAPPEYTYVLGFSPQNLKYDGSYHGLKIALVNSKGFDVQARRGYWAPNHAENASEQANEDIREAVFSVEEVRDIPVDVTTDFFKLSDEKAELTVGSHLNLNGLKFRTAGDRSQDTLTVVTGVFDQDGHYVLGIQRVIDLRLREQTLAKVLETGMDVKETFDIAPGRYVLRVVVRDAEGRAMAARSATVNIQ